MTVIRVQTGHYGRTTGSTGAYNSRLNLKESDMNHALALEVERQVAGDAVLDWEFVGPDEKQGDPCQMFIALHMDGSVNPSASGPSVGYPPGSVESQRFAGIWKQARMSIPDAKPFRADNYTGALRGYYGYNFSYSGTADVKMVLENGFVTNNEEAIWAQTNRKEVAAAIVHTVRRYHGVDTEPDDPVDVEKMRRQVDRLLDRTTRHTRQITKLTTRVDTLEEQPIIDGDRLHQLEADSARFQAVIKALREAL